MKPSPLSSFTATVPDACAYVPVPETMVRLVFGYGNSRGAALERVVMLPPLSLYVSVQR